MRRVLNRAWALATLAALAAAPAHAQFYEDVQRSLDLGPDPLARSPRMVGMGRLALVVDDAHYRFDIWEFSRNPAALFDSDTASTFELYPGTASSSTVHDDTGSPTPRERQDFALREFRAGYEAFRRTPSGAAFGLIGEFDRLRTDLPQSGTDELRSQFSMPRTSLIISGKMPMFRSDRVRYGIAIEHRYESRSDENRLMVSNAAGDYLDKDGVMVAPSGSLIPIQFGIRSVGGRLGVMYRASKWLGLAGAYDYMGNALEGRNDAERNSSEIREDRPYGTFSGSVVAHLAQRLSLVGDASHWSTGQTDQRWVASFSTGSGGLPITGRGLYQRRDETGSEVRGRATWTQDALTLSAGGSTFHRDVTTNVPPVNDRTSFNYFLNTLYGTPGADSLALPDSVFANSTKERGTEYGVGAAMHLPWRKLLVGAEYHSAHSTFDQEISGSGPDRKVWDVRTGIEMPLNPQLAVRGGYIYRWIDNDENVAQNEFVSHAVTAGIGFAPHGSVWTFDAGYLVRWGHADFGDPTRLRSSEQSGLFRIRWSF